MAKAWAVAGGVDSLEVDLFSLIEVWESGGAGEAPPPSPFQSPQPLGHFILGLGWDEMDVEYVRVHPLQRQH